MRSMNPKREPGRERAERTGGHLFIAEVIAEAQQLGDEGEGICFELDSQCGKTSGDAQGRLKIHVPGLLPGERAQVALEHVSPHRQKTLRIPGPVPGQEPGPGPIRETREAREIRESWGRVVRRLNAAPERVLPACAGYGRCGGCVLQHLAYPEQLRWKQQRVAEALTHAAVAATAAAPQPCVPTQPGPSCPELTPLGYRSRVKLVASQDRTSGAIRLGAYAPHSHDLIEMAGCKVNLPSLTALAGTVAEAANRLRLSAYDEARGSGTLRYILLRETLAGTQQLSMVVADSLVEPQLGELLQAVLAAHPRLGSVVLHRNRSRGNALLSTSQNPDPVLGDLGDAEADRVLYGDPYIFEDIGPISLRVSARSFLQVNRAIAASIYRTVSDFVEAGSRVLDLYCGVGGLGLTVLTQVPHTRLLGIEANPSAVADAWASAERLGLIPERARFLCGDVERLLPVPDAVLETVDVALLNPPRKGCDSAVLEALKAQAPQRIIYVSCNPNSLARDLAILCAGGYALRRVIPYDMHPGTPHIETLALLDRGDWPRN